jgi:hypothetical protein
VGAAAHKGGSEGEADFSNLHRNLVALVLIVSLSVGCDVQELVGDSPEVIDGHY